MSDTKILQAIFDKVTSVEQEVKKLGNQLIEVEQKLIKRIDALGEQLNELDEDAPTGEDFNNLEKRVSKLEQQVAKS